MKFSDVGDFGRYSKGILGQAPRQQRPLKQEQVVAGQIQQMRMAKSWAKKRGASTTGRPGGLPVVD